jgi:dTDP-3-amino-3,4,6-trideoxy-alpha-D-glucose transaminase
MTIPFIDLKAHYQRQRPQIDAAIHRVLESGQYILGEEVAAFEHEFADFCEVGGSVAVANGTQAIQLALMACGIHVGDEVITSTFTAVATVSAIESTGARPILVDIDPETYCLDPERVQMAKTSHTRAIVAVHLYGFPADLSSLLAIAHQNHFDLVEDCAQSHGARFNKKKVGTFGRAGAFSFYPTKNLGAYGDSGAIVTNDPDLANRLRSLRQYGWKQKKISEEKGINSRMDELQAAILRVKLTYLEADNTRRLELANLYQSRLSDSQIKLPAVRSGCDPVYHLFVIRHPRRDALQQFLAGKGITSLVHYPAPVHLQKGYIDLGYTAGDFPESESASREVLSLPFYPEMTNEMVDEVCQAILAFDE